MSAIGQVQRQIRRHCTEGETIPTSTGRSYFTVIGIGLEGIRVSSGEWQSPMITWEVLEGVVPYLSGKGNVEIGAVNAAAGKPGTLDDYFKRHLTKSRVVTYVAPILVKSGVVEYVGRRPIRVRSLL